MWKTVVFFRKVQTTFNNDMSGKKGILNKGFKNEVKSFVLLNQYLGIYDILGMIS